MAWVDDRPSVPIRLSHVGYYFLVEDVGFGGGLRTYSFRNQTVAPLRVTFTSTWRRRRDASGLFE